MGLHLPRIKTAFESANQSRQINQKMKMKGIKKIKNLYSLFL
jgi:hypothetical protein